LLENEHETLLSVVSTFKPDILFGLNDFELLRKILSFELNSFSGHTFGNMWFTTEFSTKMAIEQQNPDQQQQSTSNANFSLPSTNLDMMPSTSNANEEEDGSSTSSQVSTISTISINDEEN